MYVSRKCRTKHHIQEEIPLDTYNWEEKPVGEDGEKDDRRLRGVLHWKARKTVRFCFSTMEQSDDATSSLWTILPLLLHLRQPRARKADFWDVFLSFPSSINSLVLRYWFNDTMYSLGNSISFSSSFWVEPQNSQINKKIINKVPYGYEISPKLFFFIFIISPKLKRSFGSYLGSKLFM